MHFRRIALLLVAVVVSAAACSPAADDDTTTTAATATTEAAPASTTTEPPNDKLKLVLMWHNHQPLYPADGNGVVSRPWTRLHATKDYYDMAALVARYPDLHVTFNMTPVLMLQLEQLANGTKDIYWTMTEVPADELTAEQKTFIIDRFFDTNSQIVARFPRYQELIERRDRPQ